MKRTVVLGLLGTTLDIGSSRGRWERWRPTIDLCRHDDLVVDRLELLVQPRARAQELASVIERDLESVSPETSLRRHDVEFEDPWDFEEVFGTLLDFARSYRFDTAREDYLVHITTGTHVAQICMFLLTESRYLPARLIQTSPPGRDRDGRPGPYHVIDLDLSRYDQIASRFQQAQREGLEFLKAGIDTRNAAFNQLIERIEQVAIRSTAPLLLMGPTGAGKTHLARRIYELKRARRQVEGRFVEVNCATLRGDTAMSTLFGHVRGAFTGAGNARAGLLKSADGGVLFLDEIGELGLDEQATLLRAIEDKRFLPVGSDRELESDFQLIAGTNRDLRDAVRDGRFREDLLARIDLWTFRLPGLRDRLEDIEPNLDFELERFGARVTRKISLNRAARAEFLRFATSGEATWSANFRDLGAAVERMATLAPGGRINEAIVDEEIERLRASWGVGDAADPGAADDLAVLRRYLSEESIDEIDRFDRVQLAEVLRVCGVSRSLSEAGRLLFAASRRRRKSINDSDRVRKYLARFDLTFGELRPES
ncbi:MAG: sigma 54-interacting transcriptional regulator [Myxococcales bacterium]|nr:RNA repair transcriptional activator RtcR [Myxococcales bacterium]MCB9753307.1 sigma 54-interacting transcriptional regulator [Myxococcales bacterium]